ncbi:MAG: hypothetical protein ACTSV1_07275 [Alphaproteobacteria bacterium]
MKISDISGAVGAAGFTVFSGLASETAGLRPGRTVVLIGNAGPDMWRAFSDDRPGTADPLDTWTRARLAAIAGDLSDRFGVSVEALFPFDGPPHHPFQRWALAAGTVHPSPIGPLMHPQFGLWHGYRAAFLVGAELTLREAIAAVSPCDDCADKPCLSTCPVAAFDGGSLDVGACIGHLSGVDGDGCLKAGCLARRACPVGENYAYAEPQARFHMQAFFDAYR